MDRATVIMLFLASIIHMCCARSNITIPTVRNINEPISTNLRLVAVADGKAYFSEHSKSRNWYEARDFCAQFRMQLADITSPAQFDALQAAYSPTDFYMAYWTSGRDIQTSRQFAWDTTGAPLDNVYPRLSYNQKNPIYQTCVFYWSESQSRSHSVSFLRCDTRIATLCQT